MKGEDLLWLDRPNRRLDERQAARYGRVGPAGGRLPERGLLRPAPPRRAHAGARRRQPGHRHHVVLLDAGGASAGSELLPFLFADAEDDRQQYTMVVHNVTARLREAAPAGDGAVSDRGRGGAQLPRPGRPRPGPPDGRGRPAGPALGRARPSAPARSTRSSAASTARCPTSSTSCGPTCPTRSATAWCSSVR